MGHDRRRSYSDSCPYSALESRRDCHDDVSFLSVVNGDGSPTDIATRNVCPASRHLRRAECCGHLRITVRDSAAEWHEIEPYAKRYNRAMPIGRTVHVVPSHEGNWQVVDLKRHVLTFPSKASAVERAKSVAESNQPSQVVLFDERGRPITLARFQLPRYDWDTAGGRNGLVEAAVKAVVIRSIVAAGAMVAPELLDSVDRDLKKETGKAKTARRRTRGPSR
jgi:hypothetical protein